MGRLLVFWCDKVQPAYRKASAAAATPSASRWRGIDDSFQSFYTFMDAYNVKLVDDDGKLTSMIQGARRLD